MDEIKLEGTVSASDVAAHVLWVFNYYNKSMIYSLLHYILYCTQAISLVRYGVPLFYEEMEARARYDVRVISDHPLLRWPKRFTSRDIPKISELKRLSPGQIECIKQALVTGLFLVPVKSWQCHFLREARPWIDARKSPSRIISLDEMRAWYRTNTPLWMVITPPGKVRMPFDEEKVDGEYKLKRREYEEYD